MSNPYVDVSRSDPVFLEMIKDPEMRKESHNIFRKMNVNHIEYLIRLQVPEINQDFPDDFPPDLEFHPMKTPRDSNTSTDVSRNRDLGIVKKEAEEFIGDKPVAPRVKRFTGTYNLIEREKKMLNQHVPKSSRSVHLGSRKPPRNILIKKTNPNTKKYVLANPDSSSSDISNSTDTNDDSDVSTSSSQKEQLPTTTVASSFKPRHGSRNVPPKPTISISKPSRQVILKDNKQTMKSNEENQIISMVPKSNAKEIQKKVYTIPPVIQPPMLNPKTLKTISGCNAKINPKVKAPYLNSKNSVGVESLEELGGIFTINNGWEKTLDTLNNNQHILDMASDSLVDPEEQFEKELKQVNEFNFDQSDGTESENDEDGQNAIKKKAFSSNETSDASSDFEKLQKTSEDDVKSNRDGEFNTDKKAISEPPLKRRKTSECVEESLKNIEGVFSDDEDDRISFDADLDDLDDVDYEPPGEKTASNKIQKQADDPVDDTIYTTELDDLKMFMRKELPESVAVEEAKAIFDRNTEKIIKEAPQITDDVASRVLERYFNGTCPGFLENFCNSRPCKLHHRLPEIDTVRMDLAKASISETDEAYGVISKYSIMFEKFIFVFAESYIKKTNDYELNLAKMIKDCEKTARTHQLYRQVVEALVMHGNLPRYKAIKLLISYHTDSPYAQETILKLIVETGPDLIRLMQYLVDLSAKRTLPIPILDQIICNCVTYQEPKLPTFCLDRLLVINDSQINQINQKNLISFLKLQTDLEAESVNRNAKCLALLSKKSIQSKMLP